MFSFFKKSKKAIDYTFLKTDMHSHLIPGVDDGAKTVEESIQLIRKLQAMGFQKIITTPHILKDHYPNSPATIREGERLLRVGMEQAGLDIVLEVAAEYYVDEYFETLLQADEALLTFSGKHILIEFSTFSKPVNAEQVLFTLTTKGYQPILAHPERYLYYANQIHVFEKFKAMGCALQLNLLSLGAYYGKAQQKLAIDLLKANLVDYLGTDLHRQSQIEPISGFTKDIVKLLQTCSFDNEKL